MNPERIVFAGTPAFAAGCLRALLDAGYPVCAAYTQPDRPAGRGKKLQASPVKQLAQEHGIPVFQPVNFRDPADISALAALKPDIVIVVAYGLLLPQAVLDIPRLGCINVHASLLPRWRGAAPIERAIEAGDRETGITLMQMDAGLDTGAMLLVRPCAITAEDTGASLRERLAGLGAASLVELLGRMAAGPLQAQAQDDAAATYARKLTREEALVDWSQPAETLALRIRAFHDANPAWTWLGGERLKLGFARAEPGQGGQPPGSILRADHEGIRIACGKGVLCATALQLPGAKMLAARDLLNARRALFAPGTVLGIAPQESPP